MELTRLETIETAFQNFVLMHTLISMYMQMNIIPVSSL